MSILNDGKYCSVELNRCAFQKDGRVASTLELDTTIFSATHPLENGMIVGIDEINNKVKNAGATGTVLGVVYTTEDGDGISADLNKFAMKDNKGSRPRVGYVTTGDIYTTDAIDISTITAVSAGDMLVASTTASRYGYYTVTTTTTLAIAKVKATTTLPNGDAAVKVYVL